MSGQIREKSVEKGNHGTGALGLNHTPKEARAVHAITQSQPRATLESKQPASTAAQTRLLRYYQGEIQEDPYLCPRVNKFYYLLLSLLKV